MEPFLMAMIKSSEYNEYRFHNYLISSKGKSSVANLVNKSQIGS